MNSAIDITSEQRKTLVDLVRQYIPGVAVWAYGSRVKWTARPNSDLDLVAFTAPAQNQLVSELKNALAESELPFLVDLHVWDEIPERFRQIIRGEYVVIQEQKDEPRQLSPGRDWRISTWGEEISLEYGKALRGYSSEKGEYRVYGSNGPIGWTGEPLAPGPGIILGRKGAYRGIQFCSDPFYVIDTAYYVVPKTELDMRWLYYAMAYYKLGEIDDGSPIPSTTRSAVYIREFEIPTPREQRNIAGILGALDDRIELNRKLNETLEATARAVFKSWFVDFDPVRAKAEGREPDGMDADTAALFPGDFVHQGDTIIPAGWTEGILSDVCEVARTGVQKAEMRPDENYVGLEHIPRESWSLPSWGTAEDLQSGKSRFQQGNILFGKLRPYFHKVCVAPVDGVCSTDILVLRPKNPEWMAFVLCLVSSKQMIDYATRLSNGAKMPRSSWHDLSVYKVILPSESLAEAFNRIVKPIVGKIIANVHTAATLTALRDTLLPRLISGKLRVPEAEAMLIGGCHEV